MLIWTVEIEGVSLPENEALFREELAKMGVKPGKFKFLVDDPQVIQRNMIEAIPDVTWVGFQFQGNQSTFKSSGKNESGSCRTFKSQKLNRQEKSSCL